MSESEILNLLDELRKLDNLLGTVKPMRKVVYTNAEMKELLGVEGKLLQKWRDNGIIGYSRIGDKIFYTEKDLDDFLRRNHREPYNTLN